MPYWLDNVRASFSFFTTVKLSPNSGKALKPVTTTGADGEAVFTGVVDVVDCKIRTFAYVSPATIKSPTFKTPCSTNATAMGPLPCSI